MLFEQIPYPNGTKKNIAYDIVCDIAYDMKPKTCDVQARTYDIACDEQCTMSYIRRTILMDCTISYV